jgi:hypothetical protein
MILHRFIKVRLVCMLAVAIANIIAARLAIAILASTSPALTAVLLALKALLDFAEIVAALFINFPIVIHGFSSLYSSFAFAAQR